MTSNATLGAVLAELGSAIAAVAIGSDRTATPLTAVVIYDPFDLAAIVPNSLVLGVGVGGDEPTVRFAQDVAERGGAAIVLREAASLPASTAAAVDAAGVTVVSLVPGVPWRQVANTVAALITRHSGSDQSLTGLGVLSEAADMRALANTVAAMVDAPITIEDIDSNIVAFSADVAGADNSRRAAILGQRVSPTHLQRLRVSGLFHKIYADDSPVFVRPGEIYERGRVVVRITAGDTLLGSIWAVADTPLSHEGERIVCEAARIAAVLLLREQATADTNRRERRRQLSSLLAGGDRARHAAAELKLNAHRFVVLGVRSADPLHGDAADVVRMERIVRTFELHLLTRHPHSMAGTVGDVTYGILPITRDHVSEESYLTGIADAFISQSASRLPVSIGIGRIVDDVGELDHSMRDSERVLRVVRNRDKRSYRIDEVEHDIVLTELRERWERTGRSPFTLVNKLIAYDSEHGTQLVQTINAHFDCFGDVRTASDRLIIHPNTFRLRLRRVQEVCGVDLADANERFLLMLQLRIHRMSPGPG